MRIALFSDTHLTPAAPAFDANLAAVRRWVTDAGITHSVHLGDLSANGVNDPAQLVHARDRLADWPGKLGVLPGNHDVGDNPRPGTLRADDRAKLDAYTALFGPDRWVSTIAGWTFIGLNAQLYGRGDELEHRQDAWLADVASDASGPVGLFLHKPLFRTTIDDGDGHHRYLPPATRAPLLATLAAVDLRFVVAGHTHQTRRLVVDGVEHVWTPSAAFTLPDGMQETVGVKEVGAMLLTLDGDRHHIERVIPDGMLTYDLAGHAHIYPAHADAIRAAAHG